jgi:ankyrin repeat protein
MRVKFLSVRLPLLIGVLGAATLLGGWKLAGSSRTSKQPADLTDALLAAVREGNRENVQSLLARGADVNAPDVDGTSPLMQAALNADTGLMEFLLDQGADPRAEAPNHATALLRAVHDFDKVKLLLRHGALVRDEEVVLAALVPGSAKTVRLLLAHGRLANANMHGFTALMAAATAGDLDTVMCLLDQGADVQRKREDGYTALHGAALSGNVALAQLLLDRGADPNAVYEITNPTYDLQTPATMAAWLGHTEVLRRLLAKGADVNSQGGSFERTALLYAATTGNEESVNVLLARGVNVNARDWAGHTPLYWARRRGETPVVKRLEQAGAVDPSPLANAARPALLQSATGPDAVRHAIVAALPPLQRTGPQFTQRKGCVSCHHQSAVALTTSLARSHGFKIDEETAAQERAHIIAYLDESRERLLCGNGLDALLAPWTLWSLGAEGQKPSPLTDALVHYLILHQKTDGSWKTRVYRPPHDASDFAFTALAVRGLQLFAPPGRARELERRIVQARDWLVRTAAAETEDKANRLLGLRWAGTGEEPIREAVAQLLREQRPDGGWAQLPTLPSDAYATGEVLYALHEGGAVPPSAPTYQRGVSFLLRTQRVDGTWFVPTRSFPVIEAFNSGFPYGRSQFISTAGTCWATLALLLTTQGKDGY